MAADYGQHLGGYASRLTLIAGLVERSYRIVALKRMLSAPTAPRRLARMPGGAGGRDGRDRFPP
jgi:hypothetical protein